MKLKTSSASAAAWLVVLLAGTGSVAHADLTYTDTTQLTGGSMLQLMKVAGTFSKQARQSREPVVSTVIVKGNRLARIGEQSTEIIDLDRETVTTIDHVKRQYTVMTFEQIRQQVQQAIAKSTQQQRTAPPAPQPASNTDLTFQVHVRNTGATKDVAGVNARESILALTMDATDKTSGQTGSMAITNDLWLAPDIPGYGEVRDFYVRYAEKMKIVFSGMLNPGMFSQYPGAGQGMADMVKEMSKLKGIPVLQVMRMGMTMNGAALPAASEAPLPPSPDMPEMPSAGEVAQQTAQQSATAAIASKLGAFGGLAGGFGGFGHKKKADPPPPPSDEAKAAAPATAAVLIESNTQLASFSQASVDPTRFAVPAGYEQITPASSH
ncbi:MAG: hypothetical protein M3Y50_15485 [Acidobacteriota bacterium]|nr:hypothetical protein [Acidobacteriota bacterium]